MDCQRVKYTGHALQRMFQRQVSRADVATVLADGDVIEDYPTEQPLPSCLVYAAVAGRPLHVVLAHDAASKLCLVVTVYEPDAAVWLPDWRTRRNP